MADRREFSQPRAVAKTRRQASGRLNSQPGLAGPSGADQGDQAVVSDEARDACQFLLSGHERVHRARQVPDRALGGIAPRQGRRLDAALGVTQCVQEIGRFAQRHPDGVRDVLWHGGANGPDRRHWVECVPCDDCKGRGPGKRWRAGQHLV